SRGFSQSRYRYVTVTRTRKAAPMSDTERVRAWRQRLKDRGLVPMMVWVKPETKARYQDLALQSHRSGSALVQLALDAYRLDPALVSAAATDTEQIRAIIREELDEAMAIMTATVTAMVTDTVQEMLPDNGTYLFCISSRGRYKGWVK